MSTDKPVAHRWCLLLLVPLVALVSVSASSPRATSEIVVSGFSTPESVMHDEVADLYLVSNINGSPGAFDNNGFISRVWPDGTIAQLKWIRAGVNGVTLNAPKGLAIDHDTLYVADIDTLRAFDRVTGDPVGVYPIPNPGFPNPLFLNDVAVAPDGTVYMSDNVNSAIFSMDRRARISVFASGSQLKNPNGILADGANNVSWVTWVSNEILRTTPSGHVFNVATLPLAGPLYLDGYVRLPDGSRLVSSWVTSCVHQISASGHESTTVACYADGAGPADIGYDRMRNNLLVPLFVLGQLVIRPL